MTSPAIHEMVVFQMMSVSSETRPTNRSAKAKFFIKKFIRLFLPFDIVNAISTVPFPMTINANSIHKHVRVST